MSFPSSMLIHQANLETSETLGAADIAGIKATVKVYTAISCRFDTPAPSYKREGGAKREGDAGYHTTRTPQCIVPAGAAAVEGKTIVGLTAPYARTYLIKSVKPAGGARTISHYVLDLEAVDG